MTISRRRFVALSGSTVSTLALGRRAAFAASASERENAKVRAAVEAAIKPIVAQYAIPGLAVGVTIEGRRHFVEVGHASLKPRTPATRDTLFELGSISKTFTATLASLAAEEGKLAFSDTVGQHMPELAKTPVGDVRLLDLATHTAGGFPLQLPAEVKTEEQLIAWYRAWTPQYVPGAMRTYSNPGIGLLGKVTARALGERFTELAEGGLFPGLGLTRTYLNVPERELVSYAWGTNRNGRRVRMGLSPIATEAWGVKSNTADMLRFLEVNMGQHDVPAELARAVAATHTGYYRAGPFIQDLIWEQYPMPAALDAMLTGNASEMALKPQPATAIQPPMPPRADVILNKTGSTAGFGAYVFALPEKQFGIVMLANKPYPNEARTRAAYDVMTRVIGAN